MPYKWINILIIVLITTPRVQAQLGPSHPEKSFDQQEDIETFDPTETVQMNLPNEKDLQSNPETTRNDKLTIQNRIQPQGDSIPIDNNIKEKYIMTDPAQVLTIPSALIPNAMQRQVGFIQSNQHPENVQIDSNAGHMQIRKPTGQEDIHSLESSARSGTLFRENENELLIPNQFVTNNNVVAVNQQSFDDPINAGQLEENAIPLGSIGHVLNTDKIRTSKSNEINATPEDALFYRGNNPIEWENSISNHDEIDLAIPKNIAISKYSEPLSINIEGNKMDIPISNSQNVMTLLPFGNSLIPAPIGRFFQNQRLFDDAGNVDSQYDATETEVIPTGIECKDESDDCPSWKSLCLIDADVQKLCHKTCGVCIGSPSGELNQNQPTFTQVKSIPYKIGPSGELNQNQPTFTQVKSIPYKIDVLADVASEPNLECRDAHAGCFGLKKFCSKESEVIKMCPKTCGTCSKGDSVSDAYSNCKDKNPDCVGWKSLCSSEVEVVELCPKTCGTCITESPVLEESKQSEAGCGNVDSPCGILGDGMCRVGSCNAGERECPISKCIGRDCRCCKPLLLQPDKKGLTDMFSDCHIWKSLCSIDYDVRLHCPRTCCPCIDSLQTVNNASPGSTITYGGLQGKLPVNPIFTKPSNQSNIAWIINQNIEPQLKTGYKPLLPDPPGKPSSVAMQGNIQATPLLPNQPHQLNTPWQMKQDTKDWTPGSLLQKLHIFQKGQSETAASPFGIQDSSITVTPLLPKISHQPNSPRQQTKLDMNNWTLKNTTGSLCMRTGSRCGRFADGRCRPVCLAEESPEQGSCCAGDDCKCCISLRRRGSILARLGPDELMDVSDMVNHRGEQTGL